MPDLQAFSKKLKYLTRTQILNEVAARRLVVTANNTDDKAFEFIRNFYPPVRRRRMIFKTDKQRRYFFWALRRGIIKVPARRTGRLRRAVYAETVQTNRNSYTFAVVVDLKRAPYAPYVIGQKQAEYHAGNWLRLATSMRASRNLITERATMQYLETMNGFFTEFR